MQVKLILLIPSVLATVALSTPVSAQMMPTSPALIAQATPGLSAIELTAQQQAAIREIATALNTQIETILTTEQTNQLQTAVQNGEDFSVALMALGLTEQQQQDLQSAFQSAQQRTMQLLTEQQREQLFRNIGQ